jgi:hypothetical protein
MSPQKGTTMLNFAKDLAAALDALRRHAILFLLGVTLISLALLGRSWLDAHDASLRLQATLAAQQKTITDADQRQSTRDAQLTQTLAQITAAKQKVQTPTQAAAALTQSIPQLIAGSPGGQSLPSPITIELPTGTNSTSITATGNSSAQITNAAPAGDISAATNTAPANPANTITKSGITTSYPWTTLKLELAKLGIGRATQLSVNKDSENRQGTVASKNGTSMSTNAPPTTASQTTGNVSANAGAQSGSNADANSPPQTIANAAGNLSGAQNASAPPAIIRVPQEDLKPLYDAVEDCQACQAKLAAAQGDLSDEKTKFTAASAERDAAIAAVRGTFWKRARTAAKWIAIGAAAGAVLSRYH